MPNPLRVFRVTERLAVCQVAADAPRADWMEAGPLAVTARTPHELSVVCAYASVPDGIRRQGPFTAFMVEGPLDFSLTGILARLSRSLALADIPIFAISTYDTDYVLVSQYLADNAAQAWRADGIVVLELPPTR